MAPKRNTDLRTPTLAEYQAFDGAHCRNLYQGLAPDWACPACGRTRFQILRWTLRFPNTPGRFEGWAAGLHRHHDHANNDYRYGASSVPAQIRFADTVICEQCNSADGAAKRKLGLPAAFSFAPDEIGQFVRATPHGFHEVDYDRARAIYDVLRATWEPLADGCSSG